MYKEKLEIPDDHDFVRTSMKSENRKGQDTDIYTYDEMNTKKELVARYEVRDSMCIYPPQNRTISYTKYDTSGKEIDSGRLKT
jgi:hypothetical protein